MGMEVVVVRMCSIRRRLLRPVWAGVYDGGVVFGGIKAALIVLEPLCNVRLRDGLMVSMGEVEMHVLAKLLRRRSFTSETASSSVPLHLDIRQQWHQNVV